MTSGARYHLEPIWLERLRFFIAISSRFLFSFTDIALLILSVPDVSRSLPCFMESLVRLELPDPFPIRDSGNDLARPKSQILMLHSESTRIFAGLISL